MKVKILAFYPNDGDCNSLIGTADVAMLVAALAIRGVIIKAFPSGVQVFLPSHPLIRNGQVVLTKRSKERKSSLYFLDDRTFSTFRKAVIEALRTAYPETFINLPPLPIMAAGNTPVGALCHE